jgi:hypothetical protein
MLEREVIISTEEGQRRLKRRMGKLHNEENSKLFIHCQHHWSHTIRGLEMEGTASPYDREIYTTNI